MKVSVIIRTRNEEKTVGELLKKLKAQTFKDFETVLVDNVSSDRTLEIAKKYKIDKIIHIAEGKFSHPKSLNDSIRVASGDLIVITNGHCVPFTDTWIEDGVRNFRDKKVAGVTGWYTDKEKPDLILNMTRIPAADLSNTNSIIRKELWEDYPFDENLEGAEDYDWGLEMLSRGYKVYKDPKFAVRHYHNITPEIKKFWAKMKKIIESKRRQKFTV